MEDITLQLLAQSKDPENDWRFFYLDHGAKMLSLAHQALNSKDEAMISLGLTIVMEARFEEDWDNPHSQASLHELDFEQFIKPLISLLAKKEFSTRAMYGLWICAQEGAKMDIDPKIIEPWFDKKAGKEKIQNLSVRKLAFKILIHIFSQRKQSQEILRLLKGDSSSKEELFDELTCFASEKYDLLPFRDMIIKSVHAKSDFIVSQAIEFLWTLMKHGVDISSEIPYLFENQKKLSLFTNASTILVGYYLITKKYKELEDWINDSDFKKALNAYMGFMWATGRYPDMSNYTPLDRINGDEFFELPGIKERMTILGNIELSSIQTLNNK